MDPLNDRELREGGLFIYGFQVDRGMGYNL